MRYDIGKKIRQIRLMRGYSQEYMAVSLMVSQKAYSKYESGQTRMTLSLLEKIATILEVCHIWLLQFNPELLFKKDLHAVAVIDKSSILLEKLLVQYELRINHLESENELLKGLLSNTKN